MLRPAGVAPGHGKTVMAAYLVGTRGTPRHALALGLTVTLAHTIGVLLLALVVLSVSRVTPESFNHVTGIVSGVLVVGIGGWLFVSQGLPAVRRRLHRPEAHDHVHAHDGHRHVHVHSHARERDHVHGHAVRTPAQAFGIGLVHGTAGFFIARLRVGSDRRV